MVGTLVLVDLNCWHQDKIVSRLCPVLVLLIKFILFLIMLLLLLYYYFHCYYIPLLKFIIN